MAQFGKFGVVGVLAFLVDYGVLVALTELAGLGYLVSATISFCLSVAFNYLASMRYVFVRKGNMSRKLEVAVFFALSVVGLGLNNACMWAGVELLGISYLVVKVVATAAVSVWNFFSRKRFLEGKSDGCAQ